MSKQSKKKADPLEEIMGSVGGGNDPRAAAVPPVRKTTGAVASTSGRSSVQTGGTFAQATSRATPQKAQTQSGSNIAGTGQSQSFSMASLGNSPPLSQHHPEPMETDRAAAQKFDPSVCIFAPAQFNTTNDCRGVLARPQAADILKNSGANFAKISGKEVNVFTSEGKFVPASLVYPPTELKFIDNLRRMCLTWPMYESHQRGEELKKNVEVRSSGVAPGRGVFVVRDLPKRTIVGAFAGVISKEGAPGRPSRDLAAEFAELARINPSLSSSVNALFGRYSFELPLGNGQGGDALLFSTLNVGNALSLLNADRPPGASGATLKANCEAVTLRLADKCPLMVVVTTEDVRKDAELILDYGKLYFRPLQSIGSYASPKEISGNCMVPASEISFMDQFAVDPFHLASDFKKPILWNYPLRNVKEMPQVWDRLCEGCLNKFQFTNTSASALFEDLRMSQTACGGCKEAARHQQLKLGGDMNVSIGGHFGHDEASDTSSSPSRISPPIGAGSSGPIPPTMEIDAPPRPADPRRSAYASLAASSATAVKTEPIFEKQQRSPGERSNDSHASHGSGGSDKDKDRRNRDEISRGGERPRNDQFGGNGQRHTDRSRSPTGGHNNGNNGNFGNGNGGQFQERGGAGRGHYQAGGGDRGGRGGDSGRGAYGYGGGDGRGGGGRGGDYGNGGSRGGGGSYGGGAAGGNGGGGGGRRPYEQQPSSYAGAASARSSGQGTSQEPDDAAATLATRQRRPFAAHILADEPDFVDMSDVKSAVKMETDQDTAISTMELAKRQKGDRGGTEGRKLFLRANHFEMTFKRSMIEHYHLKARCIEEDQETGRRKAVKDRTKKAEELDRNYVLFNFFKDNCKSVYGERVLAFDGFHSLIAINPGNEPMMQPQIIGPVTVRVGNRSREFWMELKFAAMIDLNDMEAIFDARLDKTSSTPIQALNIVLKQAFARNPAYVVTGRAFYPQMNQPIDLGQGRALCSGFFCSVRPVQFNYRDPADKLAGQLCQLSLNVDVTSTAFYKVMPLVALIEEHFGGRKSVNQLSEQDWKIVDQMFIKKLKFDAKHSKTYALKPKGLAVDKNAQGPGGRFYLTSRTHTFEFQKKNSENRSVISVEQYFSDTYGITLKYPDLPLCWTGSPQKRAMHPLELLTVRKGQHVPNNILTNQNRQEIIKRTAVKPEERLRKTVGELNNSNVGGDAISQGFGIQINHEPQRVQARQLEPPCLLMKNKVGGNADVYPQDGKWNFDGKVFQEPGRMDEWGIISIVEQNPNTLRDFEHCLVACLNDFGINCGPAVETKYIKTEHRGDPPQVDFENAVFFFLEKYPKLQLLVIIIDNKGYTAQVPYEFIKTTCETGGRSRRNPTGILSQCICKKWLTESNYRQTFMNIALKINAKLGGANWRIKPGQKYNRINDEAILFLGADVTHPNPGKDSVSIAAVCGNVDSPPSRYIGNGFPQDGRMEVVQFLTEETVRVFRGYEQHMHRLPTMLIFIRDGSGEGQFKELLSKELDALRIAIKQVYGPNPAPKITFIVCVKRHHTRFFLEQVQNPRFPHIPAGTVVDNYVMDKFSFFLCSHAGIQGTSRPMHYHVLFDENRFSSDELQMMMWQLTHTYVKCARSISAPPPVYYADKIATRFRAYLGNEMNFGFDTDTKSVASGSSDGWKQKNEEERRRRIADLQLKCQLNPPVMDKMFFA